MAGKSEKGEEWTSIMEDCPDPDRFIFVVDKDEPLSRMVSGKSVFGDDYFTCGETLVPYTDGDYWIYNKGVPTKHPVLKE